MEEDQDLQGPVPPRATGAVGPTAVEPKGIEPPAAGGQLASDPVYGGAWADPPGRLEPASAPVAPACGCGGPGGGQPAAAAEQPAFVYAIGQIDFRFPSLGVEKELAQAVGRLETSGLSDRQTVHSVISQPENRYLARQLCYVLNIQGLDTYLLRPRDPADFALLVDAVRPDPRPTDLDVVIGLRGPLAPPSFCNGLTLPVVFFDQLYSFDSTELIGAIERPEQIPADRFEAASHELLGRILNLGDNAGDTDEHRAVNYLAVRYQGIYHKTVEAFAGNSALSAVEVLDSRLSGARRILDVVLSYTHRQRDVTEKFAVRLDCTEEFPFVVRKLAAYYDR
ncbi:hypothetical protein CFP65_0924 [Kitasatospora sp. MMS16-BH015]|uniref:cyanobactin maturation protease PatG family protein n=1 Tax=Kitasatospora sp. MMS16-BH015 TaxID=2018025 RepID=UPI000CA3DA9B|nr:hypothetical protein [Kitasatospora sp. MMS16-BH015]AUG75845.1 hypothetical protein CFP65_0924 [Kitasatospora sp. MMS16-BH015]